MTPPLPWWQSEPDWWRRETEALDRAGLRWERDESSFAAGIASLTVWMEGPDGQEVPLIVTFPEFYPYFRFGLRAPTLSLGRHQHPMGHGLRLMGRGTENWNSTWTVADVLQERFPHLLRAVSTSDIDEAGELEENQAEPFSDYYPYAPSLILVAHHWNLTAEPEGGSLRIGIHPAPLLEPEGLIHGAVLEVKDRQNQILAQASAPVQGLYGSTVVNGTWLRVQDPIPQFNAEQFITDLIQNHPLSRAIPASRLRDGWIRVWGVVHQEEIDYHEMGEDWVFACAFNRMGETWTEWAESRVSLRSNRGTRPNRKNGGKCP